MTQDLSTALVTKFIPLLDEVFKQASATGGLETPAGQVRFDGSKTVKVYKTTMQGLADHDRNGAFVQGEVTGEWESLTLTNDRSRTFSIDAMDNEESLEMAMGSLVGEFIRTQVVPEVDAIRFAKLATNAGGSANGSLDSSTVVAAIDAGITAMNEGEVPEQGRILYLTPTIYGALKASTAYTRFVAAGEGPNRNFETFDGMPIRKVPQTRFYTKVTLAASGAGGYSKDNSSGKDANFLIVHPSSVLQVTKHVNPRIWSPDQNLLADAWKFDYRIYHDLFVYDNKKNGVYLHRKS